MSCSSKGCCGDDGQEMFVAGAPAIDTDERNDYTLVDVVSVLQKENEYSTDEAITVGNAAGALDFAGAWEENGEEKNIHIIIPTALKWSNSAISDLSFTGALLEVTYNRNELTARVNEKGAQLQWSDGDIWKRAGFEGFWNRADFNGSCAIAGSTLTTVMRSQKSRTVPLLIISPKSFSIELDETTHTATLDAGAMVLNWSDGDVWTRALLKETTFNRCRQIDVGQETTFDETAFNGPGP